MGNQDGMMSEDRWVTPKYAAEEIIGMASTWYVLEACKHGQIVCRQDSRNGRWSILDSSIRGVGNLRAFKDRINTLDKRRRAGEISYAAEWIARHSTDEPEPAADVTRDEAPIAEPEGLLLPFPDPDPNRIGVYRRFARIERMLERLCADFGVTID